LEADFSRKYFEWFQPVFAIIRNPTLPPNYKIYFQEPLVKILNVFSETTKLIEKWGYGV
jgi:hypothetical protein